MDRLPLRQMERGVLQARKGQDSKQMLFILLSDACDVAREGKVASSCSPVTFKERIQRSPGHGGGVADWGEPAALLVILTLIKED